MSNFPQIKEWRSADGPLVHLLLVDQFGYVTHAETAASPFTGGSARFSYADFLSGRGHAEIRATLGEAVLTEALSLVGRNARLISGKPPAA